MAVILTSRLLAAHGVPHGFSTRLGGVSTGAYASLNLAFASGDDRAAVITNLARFALKCGFEASRLYQTSQVHGADVREIRRRDDREQVVEENADALVARELGVAIGIRVADCVPILFFDVTTGHIAAAHAGWKGLVAGVLANTMNALVRGGAASNVVAAIGPSIGPCCFEVGEDVAATIDRAAPGSSSVVHRDRNKPHVDLRLAARRHLLAVGLADANIEDVAGCTRCDESRFFSYRRDGAKAGRLLAAIGRASGDE